MASPLFLEDLILPTVISLLHAYQLAGFAQKVGKARGKYKVPYPAISGDDNFMRFFRAQQNTIEFTPIFFPILWASALFFHQVPAAIAGLVYCYGRDSYFKGYIQDVKERLPGFRICVHAIKAHLFMSVVGVIHVSLVAYAGISVKEMILGRLNL